VTGGHLEKIDILFEDKEQKKIKAQSRHGVMSILFSLL